MVQVDGTLDWQDGERDAFRAALFPDDMQYFVSEEEIAQYRDAPRPISKEKWTALFDRGGFYVNVGVAFAPPELALEALARMLEEDEETYWPLKGFLAVLGDGAIPIAIRGAERAVRNIGNGAYAKQIDLALEDIAPVRAPALVELIMSVLSSKAKSKTKASARAWLVRHRAIAAPIVAAANGAAAKAAQKALAERAKPAKPSALERVGWLYLRSHHVTPLVVGDFEVMKDWRGAAGVDEAALVRLPKGEVAVFEMQLRAPEVLRTKEGGVILLADEHVSSRLGDELADEELEQDALAPLVQTYETLSLTISSGALALAIAYNATPVEGADVSSLDDARFSEGETPRMPAKPPKAPLYLTELVVLPMKNGSYELRNGRTDKRLKCVLQRA